MTASCFHEERSDAKSPGLSIFDQLFTEFKNPATLLWRTIELSAATRVLQRIGLREPILDLGCAEGVITSIVFNGEAAIIGIDPWYEALRRARLRPGVCVPIRADGSAMPLRSESLGIVFSNSVIEHVSDIDAVLIEVRRVLVRDGAFVFTVPTARLSEAYFPTWLLAPTPLRGVGARYARLRNSLLEHRNLLSERVWERTLAKSGLTLDVFEPYLDRRCVRAWDILAAIDHLLRPARGCALSRRTACWILDRWLYPYVRRLVEVTTARHDSTSADACCAVIVARLGEIG